MMTITNAPIVFEAEQPADFSEVIENIDFYLKHLGLSWGNPRVIALIDRLHSAAGYSPPTPEIARIALSYQQLKAIEKKLQNYQWNPETGYGEKPQTIVLDTR